MATNTRQARKEAENRKKTLQSNYENLFCSLFDNSVEVLNSGDLPKRYLLRVLRDKGGIAYDRKTALYLPFIEKGVDVYGLPLEYTLIGYNGYNVTRKPDEVVILRANDLKFPIFDYLETQISKIVDYDMSIEQNLDACRTMTIAEVCDDASLLSLANEYEARKLGATVVFKNKNAMSGATLKVSSTGAQYLVDKLIEARRETINETLSTLGIAVANVDKRERVQGMEVLASQGYALDCINTLIDTFNYDAEVGGIPIRLKGNTSLIDQNEQQMKENETKENSENE